MKLHRNRVQKTSKVSVASLVAGLLSMNAQAIVPADLDGWSANSSGIITAACPSGFRCTVDVSEGGFMQETLAETNPDGSLKINGEIYFRSIISEKDFSSSSLVKRHGNLVSPAARHGIATKQIVGSSQTTLNAQTNFASETTMYTGWASTPGTPDLQTNQSINEVFRKAGAGGNYLEGHFLASTNISANYDHNGNRTGFAFAAEQSLVEPGQYKSGVYQEIDSQVFSMRGLEGDMLTEAGSLTLNGKSLSWSEGDKLWGFAIGQNFHHSNITGWGDKLYVFDRARGFENLGVMFESYDNRSDSSAAVNYFAYFENDVTGWPSIFGPEPVLPVSTGLNGNYSSTPGPSPTLVSGLFTPTAVGSAQTDGRDAPLPFGDWDVVDGELVVPGVEADPIIISGDGVYLPPGFYINDDGSLLPECSPSPGVVCDQPDIIAPGMVQRIVRDSEGKRYVQTIVTDLTTGFSSESFVSMAETALLSGSRLGVRFSGGTDGDKESGISLKMAMSEESNNIGAAGHLSSTVDINTGWAAGSGKPNVEISQDIDEGAGYSQHFAHKGNLDADGNNIGSVVDVDQSGINLAARYGGFHSGVKDVLGFAYRSRSGNLQTDSGGVGPISWEPGDVITATWIFGKSSTGQSSGFGGVFYDNLVDSLVYEDVGWRYSNYTGLGSNWINSAFGPSPE